MKELVNRALVCTWNQTVYCTGKVLFEAVGGIALLQTHLNILHNLWQGSFLIFKMK